jgi:serine/threonine protein kinase
LKPQNILVDKNDQIYISDFGLAKSFAEGAIGMTQTGAFLGTPRYMSPEQVEGKPTDGRSDLYSYGLILYEMVTGDVPFTGESTLGVTIGKPALDGGGGRSCRRGDPRFGRSSRAACDFPPTREGGPQHFLDCAGSAFNFKRPLRCRSTPAGYWRHWA